MDSETPIYHIKAVSDLTGLLPVTLRAWERRYGMPSPNRSDHGYRLYTEHDIKTLQWLKRRVESGLSIGIAVDQLNHLRDQGNDPGKVDGDSTTISLPDPEKIKSQLLEAFNHLDEQKAVEAIRTAFYYFPMELVMGDIFQEAMRILGDEWQKGRLPIAVEHFATQVLTSQLSNMAAAAGSTTQDGIILAACAPGETHQVGLLMVVVLLRWRGWDVRYLGPDLSLDGLEDAIIPLKPAILLFSATIPDNAKQLGHLDKIFQELPDPKPILILGGRAFQEIRLAEAIPAHYLNGHPQQIVEEIENLLSKGQGNR